MTLKEKATYINGVIDGMKLDTNTNEGKVISLLSELVSDMADEISDLRDENEVLKEYIEEIDEDLGELEEYVWDCADDCSNCDFLDEDGCCTCEDECDLCCDDECDCDDYDFLETTCPSCNEKVYLDETIDPSKIICPACFEEFSATTDN